MLAFPAEGSYLDRVLAMGMPFRLSHGKIPGSERARLYVTSIIGSDFTKATMKPCGMRGSFSLLGEAPASHQTASDLLAYPSGNLYSVFVPLRYLDLPSESKLVDNLLTRLKEEPA
jgi:hypothetical protein